MPTKKSVFVTILEEDSALQASLTKKLETAGLAVNIGSWDTRDPFAWAKTSEAVLNHHAWVIAGRDFTSSNNRSALSLCTLRIFSVRGTAFPVLLVPSSDFPDIASLPTPLRETVCVRSRIGAKCAILTETYKRIPSEFRLCPHIRNNSELWFEVGPVDAIWDEVLFASGMQKSGEGIPVACAVGTAKKMPDKSSIIHPHLNIKRQVHEIPCRGFSISNKLNSQTSYFVQVSACPEVLAFGGTSAENTNSLHVIDLV
ncbi:MAG: hypothetical protein K5657_01520 [Desulfovibrio sp.]|nr:hypothetical protein [Desulfovibrio sp.]